VSYVLCLVSCVLSVFGVFGVFSEVWREARGILIWGERGGGDMDMDMEKEKGEVKRREGTRAEGTRAEGKRSKKRPPGGKSVLCTVHTSLAPYLRTAFFFWFFGFVVLWFCELVILWFFGRRDGEEMERRGWLFCFFFFIITTTTTITITTITITTTIITIFISDSATTPHKYTDQNRGSFDTHTGAIYERCEQINMVSDVRSTVVGRFLDWGSRGDGDGRFGGGGKGVWRCGKGERGFNAGETDLM